MTQLPESDRFPYLPVHLEIGEHRYDLDALVDTGFTGDSSVPASVIPNGHPADFEVRATLADGSQISVPGYLARVRVGAEPSFPIILLALGDEPIVGLGVTNRFRLILDHGQRVIIEP